MMDVPDTYKEITSLNNRHRYTDLYMKFKQPVTQQNNIPIM